MIELIHEDPGSPCQVHFTIDEGVDLNDLAAAFTNFIRACGYSGRLVVRIEKDADRVEVSAISLLDEIEWYKGGAQPAETSTVRAAVEQDGYESLLDVIPEVWRQKRHELFGQLANGYANTKEVSDELKFLADLLREMED